jgi:hypothetical protein
MQPLGALINSGFKMIFPFGVQLPQRVDISLSTIDKGTVLYFLAFYKHEKFINPELILIQFLLKEYFTAMLKFRPSSGYPS